MNSTLSASDWWEAHRRRYTLGLIVAGVSAFVVSAIVAPMLPPEFEFEITIFSIIFQSLGYFVMMVVANLCYFLGPISESLISPKNPDIYRRVTFRLGFWFSVLLPLSIPATLVAHSIAHLIGGPPPR